ncbi:DedA family protein [Solirubrobacter phytolaccae]|uniref:DedA family protein n=1 Tax=Solirubrobacter phytolaccae TaxID=1404360 RepID=A0A9X3N7S8_9ACTN|nr:DedA family protein [Solirubrobacter phytolaccae]MDA0179964.1 DedA family protein [Solirubrobacter phytolaccae]
MRGALALIAAGLAVAIAFGAIEVPNIAALVEDATTPLGAWVYLGVGAFVFLETTVLLGFLIHGELLLMLGGAAAARGDASLVVMIAVAWLAAVAGDMASLQLGRTLGRPFIERRGARLKLGPERLARIDGFFARHGAKALFLGRFTGFLRSTMPFVVGSSGGVTLRRLLPFSVASGLVWTATFTVIGYALAGEFADAGAIAMRAGAAAILLVVAVLTLRSKLTRAQPTPVLQETFHQRDAHPQ